MPKVIKYLLIGVGSLLGLIVLAIGAILVFVDPNDYKDKLSAEVYKASGYSVFFNGPLELKILPRLAVGATDVSVAQMQELESGNLMQIGSANLHMAILPLISGRVEISGVHINDVKLNLVTGKQGQNNWESAKVAAGKTQPSASGSEKTTADASAKAESANGESAKKTDAANTATEATKAQSGKSFSGEIASVSIERCSIHYRNLQQKMDQTLALNELRLSNVALGKEMTFYINTSFEDVPQKRELKLTMQGSGLFDDKKQLAKLNITQSKLDVKDAMLNQPQTIEATLLAEYNLAAGDTKLTASLKNTNLNADFSTNGVLGGSADQMDLSGNFKLQAKPRNLTDILQIKLGLPDKNMLKDADAAFAFALNGNKLNLKNLTAAIDQDRATLQGDASFDLATKDFTLTIPKIAARLREPVFTAEQKFNGKLNLQGNVDKMSAKGNIALNGQNLSLASNLNGSMPKAGSVQAAGDASVKGNLRELLKALNVKLDTADKNALSAANADFKFNFSGNVLSITTLKGKVDNIDFSGTNEIKLAGAKTLPKGLDLAVNSNMQFGSINANSYLPPQSNNAATQKPAPAANTGAGAGSATAKQPATGLLKGTALEKADIALNWKLNALNIQKIETKNITLQARANKGTVTVQKAQLSTFGGSITATGSANLLQAVPPVSINGSVKSINAGNALQTLANEKRLTCIADSTFNLNFKGLDWANIAPSLNGNASLALTQGMIRDFQIIPENAPPKIAKYRQKNYPFDRISASANIKNGLAQNNDFTLSSPKLTAKGKGSIDLAKSNLDYRLTVSLPEKLDLPLRFSGSFGKPHYRIDEEELARTVGKSALQEAAKELQKKGKIPADINLGDKEEAKTKVEEKINKEIGRGLKKLFK